ncbi:MAG TPA: ATP-binding protein, partial [Phycisphaerae bacterium]
GRPLSDLNRKFEDPTLISDCRAVLEKLIPLESEISSSSGNWYVRRILPYRTTDNRIEGVVITFIDISRRRLAEVAQRESEERYRLIVQGVKEYAIIMLDVEGRIATWNIGAQRVLGFTEQEALGQHYRVFFTPEDRASGEPEEELQRARLSSQSLDERWYLRHDGIRFWGSGTMTALMDDKKLRRGFVKVMRDNTDRKIADDHLNIARLQAEAANEAKDQFLATISHELRTPLSSILLWTKMISSGAASPADLEEGIAAIQRAADAQKNLIEDLLDSSRISSGKLRLNLRQTDLAAVIRSAVESILPEVKSRHLILHTDLSPGVGLVWADADRLQQVVWNLLTNAVKFTPAGGHIHVRLWVSEGQVFIRVSDTGKGIEASFLKILFVRFTQAQSPHTRTQGGLGLGLAISKQLAELHGGTIVAESAGVDRGTTFTVSFPIRTPELEPSASKAAQAPCPPNCLTGVHILLVEDDLETSKALLKVLKTAGANVTFAPDAARALQEFSLNAPQLIISDIGLPETDGYTFIRQIRAVEARRNASLKSPPPPTPSLALTAFASDRDHAAALNAGFQRHLSKPLDPNTLLSAILGLIT